MTTKTLETPPRKLSLLPPTEGFPWPTAMLNTQRLTSYLAACESRGVWYEMGAKADNLTAMPPDYTAIDCSGWVRAAVAYATDGALILPDGSSNQNDWCRRAGLKRSHYLACCLGDGLVRIAFHAPSPAHPTGHVWLVRNRQTYESYSGSGPGSRSFAALILRALVSDVYILGTQL